MNAFQQKLAIGKKRSLMLHSFVANPVRTQERATIAQSHQLAGCGFRYS